ncbi:MAG: PD-(D/E)XK nuclease family protein [Oscillospiraceae bacterium]|nr:PD-(D/E)XK nuclease family protein [Oscillospiraceae bacterium]
MVKIMIGRAGSGKTARIIEDIKERGGRGETGMLLIVPEQFSHDAERELCRVCGDGVSLYAEVLSFSRLANRVLSETGGCGVKPLDPGGRLLIMNTAMARVETELKTFGSVRSRAELLTGLIRAWDEFSAAGKTPKDIEAASESVEEAGLSDKLHDMALIFGAYNSLIPENMCDPFTRLEMTAENLESSRMFGSAVYFDGFTDFTYQQMLIVRKLMKMGADMTFALTMDTVYTREEIFRIPRDTLSKLVRYAKEAGAAAEIAVADGTRPVKPELRHLEKNLLRRETEKYGDECRAVELFKARGLWEECELAASKAVELVRDKKLRWRDICVVSRDFGGCSSMLESAFSKYGVPVMNTDKSDILAKPVIALITSAIDIVAGGWAYEDVFRYLKTELTGLDRDDRDILENYVLKWNIRGGKAWLRDEPWKFHPRGYNYEYTDSDRELLDRLNGIRIKVAEPFGAFEKSLRGEHTAAGKARALYAFLTDADVPAKLEEKVKRFREKGEVQLAGEYLQLWEIIVRAIEQFADVLGDTELDIYEFRRLFALLLSQYQVGTIPMALDRVMTGDMSKLRRRDVKCLMVIGATDEAMPKMEGQRGLLSDFERDEMKSHGLELNDDSEQSLFREYNLIYTSLTLPSEHLIMSYSGVSRPSFVLLEIGNIFGIDIADVDEKIKENALLPCLELAVGGDAEAREYLSLDSSVKERLDSAAAAAAGKRGQLSPRTAGELYSRNMNLSASRVDKFHSCRFMYFMEYGLRAKPRQEAKFDAPAVGTFMHYILENVARDAEDAGGFGKISREDCIRLTKKYVRKYADEMLGGLKEKSARFIYLFRRLSAAVERIVADMAEELAVSDFSPVDFELSFGPGGDIGGVQVTDGDMTVNVNGKVDRVDGWVHDGRLYLRVVDYKTGKKSFSLSDVWYGMGMQMLMYLSALERSGKERYGKEIVPAGVLYAPAADVTVPATLGMDEKEIEKERAKKLVRNGLLLDDPEMLKAMEKDKTPKYLPIKLTKEGNPAGDSLCTAEQFGSLVKHIDGVLIEMAKELRRGSINADPYLKNQQDNACVYCRYFEACHFDESRGDRMRYIKKLKSSEVWDKLREKRGQKNG